MKRTLLILLILGFALFAGTYFFFTYAGKEAGSQQPSLTITAQELYEQYSRDEAAGNQQFLDQILQVSGTVIDKLEDEEGAPVLILGQADAFSGVMCTLSGQADVSSIAIGDGATVRGKCTGMLTDVVLNECRIME